MSDKKSPREMAEEIERELKKRFDYREQGASAQELILMGLKAGAKMGWDRLDDYLTGDMISFVRSFDEWWASINEAKDE